MKSNKKACFVLGALGLAIGVVTSGCEIGETHHITVTLPPKAAAQEIRTCDSPHAKVDLTKLKACNPNGGKGHCYDATKSPMGKDQLEECEGSGGKELCVPDNILEAGGGKLKACKFLNGKEGACMSLVVREIGLHKGELQPDSCDKASERCAPCIDPRNGQPTPVCDATGVHEQACKGGGTAEDDSEECCHGAGVCLVKEGLPEDQRENMEKDQCSDGKLCAPLTQVNGTPVFCDFLGTKGVCIDVCMAKQVRSMGKAIRANCGPTEVCLPCAIGAGQGVVGCK